MVKSLHQRLFGNSLVCRTTHHRAPPTHFHLFLGRRFIPFKRSHTQWFAFSLKHTSTHFSLLFQFLFKGHPVLIIIMDPFVLAVQHAARVPFVCGKRNIHFLDNSSSKKKIEIFLIQPGYLVCRIGGPQVSKASVCTLYNVKYTLYNVHVHRCIDSADSFCDKTNRLMVCL